MDSLLRGAADDFGFAGVFVLQLQNHVQPGTLTNNSGLVAETTLDGLEQGIMLFLVHRAHAPDMAFPVAQLYEPCHGFLFQQRDRGKIIVVQGAERGEQQTRQHHVAQAQGRGEDLGKCPGVDDVPVGP